MRAQQFAGPHADAFKRQFTNQIRLGYKRRGPMAKLRQAIDRARSEGLTDAADRAMIICLTAQSILDGDNGVTANTVRLVHALIVIGFEALGLAPVGTGRAMAIRQGTVEPDRQDSKSDMPVAATPEMQLRRKGYLFMSPRETSVRESDPRWPICNHESAHATVLLARRQSAALQYVVVHETSRADGERGHCCYDATDVSLDIQRDIFVAGLSASMKRSSSGRGAYSDLSRLQQMGFIGKYVNINCDDPFFVLREAPQLSALRGEVASLLAPHESFQRALADALYVLGLVTGDQVRAAVGRYEPGTTASARELFGI